MTRIPRNELPDFIKEVWPEISPARSMEQVVTDLTNAERRRPEAAERAFASTSRPAEGEES